MKGKDFTFSYRGRDKHDQVHEGKVPMVGGRDPEQRDGSLWQSKDLGGYG